MSRRRERNMRDMFVSFLPHGVADGLDGAWGWAAGEIRDKTGPPVAVGSFWAFCRLPLVFYGGPSLAAPFISALPRPLKN